VAQGTPEEVALASGSFTAPYLKDVLEGSENTPAPASAPRSKRAARER
jgi:hypothetical protein